MEERREAVEWGKGSPPPPPLILEGCEEDKEEEETTPKEEDERRYSSSPRGSGEGGKRGRKGLCFFLPLFYSI